LEQYLYYFCGDANDPNALNTTEPLRISFYKATVTFLRTYAEVAGNLAEVGYSPAEIAALEKETQFTPTREQQLKSIRAKSWTSSLTRRTCATSSTPTSRLIPPSNWAG
jgi:hypothetical protein